ncbi:MAG: sulfatase [Planctomycetaceae bacterium]|nr:sulfatase [Planctomycetaceae bacterium]
MNLFNNPRALNLTRRHFFQSTGFSLGATALANLQAAETPKGNKTGIDAALPETHFPGKCKNIIYLHMVGGPAQMDLYDYKPEMEKHYGEDLPESIRKGQRLTTMTSGQAKFPVAPSKYRFKQKGQCGMWMNDELLPYTAKMADDMVFIRSMNTEAINHEPAITYMQTGNQVTGRPCLGAWTSYGLGSLNQNLPTFVVMVAKPSNQEQVQAISARLWQSGYLPGEHAAVSFRAAGDPILFINNPPGVTPEVRRTTLDGLNKLNGITADEFGDPETKTRMAQYEMAYRMQASVPELADISTESAKVLDMYGPDVRKPGSFANTALTARRLVERGVRFVQVYHNNWDHHGNLAGRMPDQCKDVDQPCWALIQDLKRKGLFDSTLVIWGGEFGRTIYSQGGVSKTNYGRDHHPRCFTMWMAGGGTKGGTIYGETDDYSYNIVKDPVHIRDFHATVLHLMGIDHDRFSYRYLGLDQKLTGVEKATVIKEMIS